MTTHFAKEKSEVPVGRSPSRCHRQCFQEGFWGQPKEGLFTSPWGQAVERREKHTHVLERTIMCKSERVRRGRSGSEGLPRRHPPCSPEWLSGLCCKACWSSAVPPPRLLVFPHQHPGYQTTGQEGVETPSSELLIYTPSLMHVWNPRSSAGPRFACNGFPCKGVIV